MEKLNGKVSVNYYGYVEIVVFFSLLLLTLFSFVGRHEKDSGGFFGICIVAAPNCGCTINNR